MPRYWINIQYYWGMDELTPTQWISKRAESLRERWRTVPSADLKEVAIDIWRDAALRELSLTRLPRAGC
jgi:hypothetical protein